MYTPYSLPYIVLRRFFVLVAGVLTFPVMVFTPESSRSRFYSFLYRYWLKNSSKPLWLQDQEQGLENQARNPKDLF